MIKSLWDIFQGVPANLQSRRDSGGRTGTELRRQRVFSQNRRGNSRMALKFISP